MAIQIQDFEIGKDQLTFFCGPCVIESEIHALKAAEHLKKTFSKHSFNFIFKASCDKANRSSIASYRGPGLEKGLRILEKIKNELDLPVITDVHTPQEAISAAQVCDVIQIPAFLCRQTDLLVAAGLTNKPLNIKKGQFMAPHDMKHVIDKVLSTKNNKIILTDRGTCFGYNNLVSDMRSIPIMKNFGFPVCFDASHSIQLPGALSSTSGGCTQYIPTLAKASVAAGCDCLFIESHENPISAKCDSTSMLSFDELEKLLPQIEALHKALKGFNT